MLSVNSHFLQLALQGQEPVDLRQMLDRLDELMINDVKVQWQMQDFHGEGPTYKCRVKMARWEVQDESVGGGAP